MRHRISLYAANIEANLFIEVENFKKWASIRRDQRTVRAYCRQITKFIIFSKKTTVSELVIEDIIDYHQYLMTKSYASGTVALMMTILRQFCKYLFYQQKLLWDYRLVEIPSSVNISYIPIEPEDSKAMIDRIKVTDILSLRDKCIISMLYATGMRTGEICTLEIGEVSIKESKAFIISKKNKMKRLVLWDKDTNKLLKKYLKTRPRGSKYVFGSLAPNQIGERITSRTVQRIVEKYRRNKNITGHSFRHGFGVRAVRSGMHLRYIQKLLGHKSIQSTEVYLNIADKDIEDAYRKM